MGGGTTVPALAGDWTLQEIIDVPAVGGAQANRCVDQGILTIAQAGDVFTGSVDQTGECTYTGGFAADNFGIYSVVAGLSSEQGVSFVEPGTPDCRYSGTGPGGVTSVSPTSLSGTIVCDGTSGGVAFRATGTWRAERIPVGSPRPGGTLSFALVIGGSNPLGYTNFLMRVSTADGPVYERGVTANLAPSAGRWLLPGTYTVTVPSPGIGCVVTGPTSVQVTVPTSTSVTMTVECN